MQQNIILILVKTRFPENIGMVARACANMGAREIRLVCPERWNMQKASKLATAQGQPFLNQLTFYFSLSEALADCHIAFGTTARSGGIRNSSIQPWQAAKKVTSALNCGQKIALVFGPEDCGLSNEDLLHCNEIIHIPTQSSSPSLNLAQASLILLYECARARDFSAQESTEGSYITLGELEFLEATLKETLLKINCLDDKNSSYYFRAWHKMIYRMCTKRFEYDILMGLCRQINNGLTSSAP